MSSHFRYIYIDTLITCSNNVFHIAQVFLYDNECQYIPRNKTISCKQSMNYIMHMQNYKLGRKFCQTYKYD